MKIRIRLERVTRIRRWDERRENENEEKLVKEKNSGKAYITIF